MLNHVTAVRWPTQLRCAWWAVVLSVLSVLVMVMGVAAERVALAPRASAGAFATGAGVASTTWSTTYDTEQRGIANGKGIAGRLPLPIFDRRDRDVGARPRVAAEDGLRMGGSSTIGGADKATQAMIKYSAKNPEAGMYDVIGHGSSSDIAGRSASEVADRIRAASGGQDIRLLSCRTGCPSGTFAQDLANELGVGVKAPTFDIGSSTRGNTLDLFGGEWRWFSPNG